MKPYTYQISNLILGIIFTIAYFIHFIKIETFFLILLSHIITYFCLDLTKTKLLLKINLKCM